MWRTTWSRATFLNTFKQLNELVNNQYFFTMKELIIYKYTCIVIELTPISIQLFKEWFDSFFQDKGILLFLSDLHLWILILKLASRLFTLMASVKNPLIHGDECLCNVMS